MKILPMLIVLLTGAPSGIAQIENDRSWRDWECEVEVSYDYPDSDLDFCQSDRAIYRGGTSRCILLEVEECRNSDTGQRFTRERRIPGPVCISPGTPLGTVQVKCIP